MKNKKEILGYGIYKRKEKSYLLLCPFWQFDINIIFPYFVQRHITQNIRQRVN